MRLQLVLLGLFCLGTMNLCEGSNFDEVPLSQAKNTLNLDCSKDDDCPRHAFCNKQSKCYCKEKYYPGKDSVNCSDLPSDPATKAQLKQNRTLTEINCQGSTTCPKLSICEDGHCICEDGYVRAEDNRTCKAGALQVATITVFPVFISTIILCLRKFF